MKWLTILASLTFLTLGVACERETLSDEGPGGTPADGPLYPAPCEVACAKMVECGAFMAADQPACVVDCKTEPWAANYRQCRAQTCGLSERECEGFGVKSCAEACAFTADCGEITADGVDSCVADCKSEPWPGPYIDCRASICGASERQCEGFTGN